jgi:hypothetical protein
MLGPAKFRRLDEPIAVSLVPWVAERFTLSVRYGTASGPRHWGDRSPIPHNRRT